MKKSFIIFLSIITSFSVLNLEKSEGLLKMVYPLLTSNTEIILNLSKDTLPNTNTDFVRTRMSSVHKGASDFEVKSTPILKNNETVKIEKALEDKISEKTVNLQNQLDSEIYQNLKKAFKNEIAKDKVKKTYTFSQARVVRRKYYEPKTIRIIKEANLFETAFFDIIYSQIKDSSENYQVLKKFCPKYKKNENKVFCTEQLFFLVKDGHLFPTVNSRDQEICKEMDLVPSANISFDLIKNFSPSLTYDPHEKIIVPLESIRIKEGKTSFFYDQISSIDVSFKGDILHCIPDIKIDSYFGLTGQSCANDSDCMNGCCQRGVCSEKICEKKIGEQCLDSNFCAVGVDVFVVDLRLVKKKDGRLKCASGLEKREMNNFCYKGYCRDILDYSFQPVFSEKSLRECLDTSQPESIKVYGSALRQGEFEEIKYEP